MKPKTQTTQPECQVESAEALLPSNTSLVLSQAVETVRTHTKALCLALGIGFSAIPAAIATASSSVPLVLASTQETASTDAEGDIDYSKLSPAEIQNRIDDFQSKIDELKKRPLDDLSDEEFDILITYQEEVLKLEEQQTIIKNAAIKQKSELGEQKDEAINERKDAVRQNFEEIKTTIQS